MDRDEKLDLKKNCRTMTEMPHVDATESKRFILQVLNKFKWADKLEVSVLYYDDHNLGPGDMVS